MHLLLKNTIPNVNIIGAYLDCEKDVIKTEHVWSKLTGRIEIALGKGEEVILMGDLNRPLQSPILSFGTKKKVNFRCRSNINKPKTK